MDKIKRLAEDEDWVVVDLVYKINEIIDQLNPLIAWAERLANFAEEDLAEQERRKVSDHANSEVKSELAKRGDK